MALTASFVPPSHRRSLNSTMAIGLFFAMALVVPSSFAIHYPKHSFTPSKHPHADAVLQSVLSGQIFHETYGDQRLQQAELADNHAQRLHRSSEGPVVQTASGVAHNPCTGLWNCTVDADCSFGVCYKGICSTPEYVTLGDACDPGVNKYCWPGLKCLSSICQRKTIGDSCQSDAECFQANCINGTCWVHLTGGDACSSNEQCSSNKCVGGVCEGVSGGSACTPTIKHNPCVSGYWCDGATRTCLPQASLGHNCTVSKKGGALFDVCEGGSICDIENQKTKIGTCKTLFSGLPGDKCGSAGSIVCGMNLACRGGVCTDKFTECNRTTICPVLGQCTCWGCDWLANPNCKSEIDTYVHCLQTFNCFNSNTLMLDSPLIPNTCASQCSSVYKNMQCCLTNGYYDKFARPPLDCPTLSSGSTSPSWTLFSISALLIWIVNRH